MAKLPCSNCRQTNAGKLAYWYLMGWEGERSLKYRLRVCKSCMEALLVDLVGIADVQLPGGSWATPEEVI